jgi:hypothetical protein
MSLKVGFIIPGAGRSGTTSLYYCLNEHPQIQMPSNKEPGYFADRFNLGEKWYHSIFEQNNNEILGEASTRYMYDYRSPERINNYNSTMKFIFLLRNPADRAYSNYKWEVCRKGEWRTFENAVWGQSSHYLYIGLYAKHIENFLKYFKRDQLKIFQFERFVESPQEVLVEACEFLGVNADYEFRRAGRRKNKPTRPLSLALQRFLKHHFTVKNINSKVERLVKGGVREPLDWVNHLTTGSKFQGMSEDTKEMLVDFYREDLKSLDGIVKFDVSDWLSED